MSIFSNNRILSVSDGEDFEVATNENYDCTTGVAMALIDIQQNDLALFEAAIEGDFGEISAMNEGYEVINEAAMDIFKKIKELFLKLIEKIKGIFKSFMAKFDGIFMDCKQLYNKYNKTIAKNTNWKHFKVKDFRDLKSNIKNRNLLDVIEINGGYYFNYDKGDYLIDVDCEDDRNMISGEDGGTCTFKAITDKDNHIDNDDIMDELIKNRYQNALVDVIDSSNINDINKEFLDLVFEDPESRDGDDDWSTSDILHGVVGDFLKDGDKNIHKIEQYNKKLEGTLNNLVKKIDKEQQKIAKAASNARLGKQYSYRSTRIDASGNDGTALGHKKNNTSVEDSITNDASRGTSYVIKYDNNSKYRQGEKTDGSGTIRVLGSGHKAIDELEILERLVGFYQRVASIEQTLVTKLTGARLNAIKFVVGQARKVWSAAAAYASVDHKNESYEYYTAVGEAALYEYESYIQAPVY